MHKPFRTIFYGEAVLNAVAALMCLIMPERFLAMFTPEPAGAIAEALVRWYGILLVVLTIIMVRALRNGSIDMLKPVMQAVLIGDVLHLAGLWMLVEAVGQWTTGSIITAVISVALALVRTAALYWRIDLLANLHPASWSHQKRHKKGA